MNPTRVLNNLTVVEQHIAREATDVDKAIELYTYDIVWESPARDLIFHGKEAVAKNYRNMFSSIRDIEIQPLKRFATEHRVVDDAIVKFTLVGDGFVNAPVPIGTHVSLRLLHIFGMRDGKIERENVYEIWPRPAGAASSHKFAARFSGVTALLSSVTGLFSSCLDTVIIWWQRHRARRELSCLLSFDDRTLADIGVSPFQAKYEAGKWFWQPPGLVTYASAPLRSHGFRGRVRVIDGGEDVGLQQKPVGESSRGGSFGIDVRTHHLAAVVDVVDDGQRGVRDIDCGEDSLFQQKSMTGRDITAEVYNRPWRARWLLGQRRHRGECHEKHNGGDGRHRATKEFCVFC